MRVREDTLHLQGQIIPNPRADRRPIILSEMPLCWFVWHGYLVDVRKAAELYASGMSLRAVGAVMNRSAMAVCYALRKAGIPRRQCCNPNWVRDYSRVPVECAWCGQAVMERQYYQRNGSAGSNPKPGAPVSRP